MENVSTAKLESTAVSLQVSIDGWKCMNDGMNEITHIGSASESPCS